MEGWDRLSESWANGRGCYDLEVGGTICRPGFRQPRPLAPFVSLGGFEVSETDGITGESAVVEYFS